MIWQEPGSCVGSGMGMGGQHLNWDLGGGNGEGPVTPHNLASFLTNN